ncbi:MAG: sensor histidine kinase, partial [Spirochaetota bacterium]
MPYVWRAGVEGEAHIEKRSLHHVVSCLEQAGLIAILLNEHDELIDFSPAGAKLFGFSGAARGQPIHRYAESPAAADLSDDLTRLRAGNSAVERELRDPLQRWFLRRVYVQSNLSWQDRIVVVTLRDISREKEAYAAVEREVANYRSLAERLPDIVSRMDHDRRHVFVSPNATDIVDLPIEAYSGKTNSELGLPRELCEYWDKTFDEVQRTGNAARRQFSLIDKHGRERWYDDRVVPEYDHDGRPAGFLSIAREITELVHTREELQKTLEERETLITDVHHRVKNNLFLVIGLLTLEKQRLANGEITSEEIIASFDRVISRVHVVSSINMHLYEHSNDSRFLSSVLYLGELVRLVQASEAGRDVVVETDIDDVPLEASRALPLGLIVNEALSN